MLELAKLMSPEQFTGMQTLLNDIVELGNEIQNLSEKKKELEKPLTDFTDLSLDRVLGDETEIRQIEETIDDSVNRLDTLKEKAKEIK